MKKLIREHVESLRFADEIMGLAEQGTEQALSEGIEKVLAYNDQELEAHLQQEEQTVLRPLLDAQPKFADLCITIGREHGLLRTLVEEIKSGDSQKNLMDFARLLKKHTLLEDKELFPLVAAYLTEKQQADIENFTPFRRKNTPVRKAVRPSSHSDAPWLSVVQSYHQDLGQQGGSIVLFPHYNPQLSTQLAQGLGLRFFDYQQQVMASHGHEAGGLSLESLESTLRDHAQTSGIVAHNIEALLGVKSETQRRSWFRAFLDQDWPNAIYLPIAVFQGDVPDQHSRVCDLELFRASKQTQHVPVLSNNRDKYAVV